MLQAVADEARHILLHMHRHLAQLCQQVDHAGDDGGIRFRRLDHLHKRHKIGRVPPVGAKRPVLALHPRHHPADGNDRGVGGENAVGPCGRFDLGKELLLQLELFGRGLDHQISARHGVLQRRRDSNPVRITGRRTNGKENLLNPLRQRLEGRIDGIGDRHRVSAPREDSGKPRSHQACTDDGDALAHPEVYPPSA